jgi:hypothetical protein
MLSLMQGVSFSECYEPFMLATIMLIAIMLIVIMLSVIVLIAIMWKM